ncbi:MAG: PIN domain-containing protein [Microthrixaceae bacterium]|nr:PIN domain-containing protein [Microthrixaceae bacterium]HPB46696.1 PIN domain-containing protein [Microthrixaceae bacterium]
MDAFDAEALIYAAVPNHPLGKRVRRLLSAAATSPDGTGIGSVLLIPELLSKPMREGATTEMTELATLLGRLILLPVDEHVAGLAAALGSSYRLRAADAVHLATAVAAGADRFITNNQSDFPTTISEIEIVYPAELPHP